MRVPLPFSRENVSLSRPKLTVIAPYSYALVATSTDYDAWREGAAPVTVEEVMKTLSTNASLSKHITASILGAVHDAVASGKVGSSAEGSMKYSLMTPHAQVSAEELYRFSYLLPAYFSQYGEPARARSSSRPRIEEDDEVSGSYGVPQGR